MLAGTHFFTAAHHQPAFQSFAMSFSSRSLFALRLARNRSGLRISQPCASRQASTTHGQSFRATSSPSAWTAWTIAGGAAITTIAVALNSTATYPTYNEERRKWDERLKPKKREPAPKIAEQVSEGVSEGSHHRRKVWLTLTALSDDCELDSHVAEAIDKTAGVEDNNAEGTEAAEGEQSAYDPATGEINWDCPCLGGMAHGPCGEQFKLAFSCFVYSEAEPKGIDCVEKFKTMQECFREHPEHYREEIEDMEEGDQQAEGRFERRETEEETQA